MFNDLGMTREMAVERGRCERSFRCEVEQRMSEEMSVVRVGSVRKMNVVWTWSVHVGRET